MYMASVSKVVSIRREYVDIASMQVSSTSIESRCTTSEKNGLVVSPRDGSETQSFDVPSCLDFRLEELGDDFELARVDEENLGEV